MKKEEKLVWLYKTDDTIEHESFTHEWNDGGRTYIDTQNYNKPQKVWFSKLDR